jgi:hypothetical protein
VSQLVARTRLPLIAVIAMLLGLLLATTTTLIASELTYDAPAGAHTGAPNEERHRIAPDLVSAVGDESAKPLGVVRGASATSFHAFVATEAAGDLPSTGRRPTTATRREADDAARAPDGSVRCQYCNEPVVETPGSPLSREYDHVVPYSQGGGRGIDNIVVSCRTCNRLKGPRTPGQWAVE